MQMVEQLVGRRRRSSTLSTLSVSTENSSRRGSAASDLEAGMAKNKHKDIAARYRRIARRKNTRLIAQECVFTLAPMAVVIALVVVTASLAERTGDSLVDLRTALAEDRVDAFMAPLFDIQASLRHHTSVGDIDAQGLEDAPQLNSILTPKLADSPGLVAVYTAFSNHDVIKMHQEKEDVFVLQHRVYGEPNTNITDYQWARDASFETRHVAASSENEYDPFTRSWFVTAQETYDEGEHAFAWQGPDLNTEFSDLDRFSVVLSQVFRLDWADGARYSVHRLKYKVEDLNTQLASVVDEDDDSYLALVNPEGVVVATSLPLDAQLVHEHEAEGGDADSLRMIWEMDDFGVTESMMHFEGESLRVKVGARTIDIVHLHTFNGEWVLVNSVAHNDLLSHSLRNSIGTLDALFTVVIVLMCFRLALSLYTVARLLRIHDTAKTSLYDLTLDAVLIVDERTMRVLSANKSARRLLPELRGRARVAELFNQSFVEHALLSATSGSTFRHNSVEVSSFRLSDIFGSTITLVMHDMTTRDRLNKERMRRADAEHVTKERTAFMANISHEMRNPLMGVCGWADMLTSTELSGDQQLYVDNVLSCGQFALEQINHLLDASKLEAKRMEINEERVCLQSLLEKCMAVVQTRVAPDVETKICVSSSVPAFVRTDPAHLRQILINLLSNAAKFTKEGSITVHARVDVPDMYSCGADGSMAGDESVAGESDVTNDIEEGESENDERLLLRFGVEDTGCGIPADQINSLFDRFTQVRGTRGGTGLGLAIAHDLAHLLGGSMWIDSRVGEGSTFNFTVRVTELFDGDMQDGTGDAHGSSNTAAEGEGAPTDAAAAGKVMPVQLSSPRPLRVLAADDMDTNRLVLKVMLSKQGHEVVTAADGGEALQLGQDEKFDLILLDFHMPLYSGAAVTRSLRKDSINSDTWIVGLTGGDARVETECRDAGMNDVMIKPVRRATLLSLADRVMMEKI